jgi:hypothetical protein
VAAMLMYRAAIALRKDGGAVSVRRARHVNGEEAGRSIAESASRRASKRCYRELHISSYHVTAAKLWKRSELTHAKR